jgi:branched-chain amino acid transport system substrate-binding protein
MKKRRFEDGKLGIFGIVFLLVFIIFCGASFGAEKVIRFGAAVSLTGNFARGGQMTKQGYDLWMEMSNAKGGIDLKGEKHKVEIKYYDDQSDIMTSVKLVEKLITVDGIDFILAPYGSGPTFATSSITEKYERPMVSAEATSETIFQRGYRYIFNVIAVTYDFHREVFKLGSTLKPPIKRVAVVYQNVLFGQLGGKAAVNYAREHGMQVVLNEAFETGTKDLSTLVLKLAQAKPDLLASTGYMDETTLVLKQMKQYNVYIPMVTNSYGPPLIEWRKAAGETGLYCFGETQWDKKRMDFKDKVFGTSVDYARVFKAKYGYIPTYDDVNPSAAGLAFQLAIEKAQSLDPKKVRDALASLDEMTVVGRLKFNPDGTRHEPTMYIVQILSKDPDKDAVIVYPRASKDGDYVYPAPPWDKR